MDKQVSKEEMSIVEKLRELSKGLESSDSKKIEEASYQISSELIMLENKEEGLNPEFLEIEHLALDLEIPKEHVRDYEIKLLELKKKISLLK